MKKTDLDQLRLETPRLILRPPRLEDYEAWARFQGDEVATKFVGGPQARGLAWRTFMCMCGAWAMTGVAMFSVIEKSSGQWVGRVGAWHPDGWRGGEGGWCSAGVQWGWGYASVGAAAAMGYAFEVLGWEKVIHVIDPQNAASIGVAKKLGSKLQQRVTLPAPFETSICDAWGQTREQWQRAKAE